MIKLKDLLEKKFSDKEIKMAFGILNDPRYKGGNYSGAVKAIEKLKRGLSKHPSVKNALKRANEQVNEETLTEAEIVYRVRDIQKPEEDKFKQASRFGLKVSMKKQGKDTMVTLKGSKKLLRDFDRIARGKSSYGDPSTVKHFDEGVEMISENVIEKMKQIVAKKQAMKIDGVMVDMFTASAVTQIYDKVNDANKKKMEKMKPVQLANAAMKLMRRQSVEEAVSPAQQAAIAISKKEKGEKPKNECADEKDFKPHMMYDPKTGKGYMAKKYADHVRMDKMGYTHEKPEVEEAKGDRPVPYQVNVRGKGGVAVKAKDMDDAKEKAFKELGIDSKLLKDKSFMRKVKVSSKYNEVKENRARRDAMRGISRDKDFARKDDEDIRATDDDRKAADKNPIIQLRRIADLPRGGEMEFKDGKKKKISQADAKMALKGFAVMRKPRDKENFAKNAGASHTSLKKILQIVGRKR